MKLAYLLNSYPMTSTTFIRREIAAIERAGVPVKRFAVRHWSERLVDPQDMAERGRTEYLLTGKGARLLSGMAREALFHPRIFGTGFEAAGYLHRAAGGGFVRHSAYLAQAIRLRARCEALGITHVHAHFSTNAASVSAGFVRTWARPRACPADRTRRCQRPHSGFAEFHAAQKTRAPRRVFAAALSSGCGHGQRSRPAHRRPRR